MNAEFERRGTTFSVIIITMLTNLALLSINQLHNLFLSESKRFNEGIDNGLHFPDLKQIRINLREIAIEQLIRKSSFLEGFVPSCITTRFLLFGGLQ
jgi:hypothetical protein